MCLCTLVLVYLRWSLEQNFLNFVSFVAQSIHISGCKIFCKFAYLKPTFFFILYSYFYKIPTSVCLLYTLFSLNNHFIFFFFLFQHPPWSIPLSLFSFLNIILSLSYTVNFHSFSSFSHLSSPIKFSSFAPFFSGKLSKPKNSINKPKNFTSTQTHFNLSPFRLDLAMATRQMRRQIAVRQIQQQI